MIFLLIDAVWILTCIFLTLYITVRTVCGVRQTRIIDTTRESIEIVVAWGSIILAQTRLTEWMFLLMWISIGHKALS